MQAVGKKINDSKPLQDMAVKKYSSRVTPHQVEEQADAMECNSSQALIMGKLMIMLRKLVHALRLTSTLVSLRL